MVGGAAQPGMFLVVCLSLGAAPECGQVRAVRMDWRKIAKLARGRRADGPFVNKNKRAIRCAAVWHRGGGLMIAPYLNPSYARTEDTGPASRSSGPSATAQSHRITHMNTSTGHPWPPGRRCRWWKGPPGLRDEAR